MTPCAEPGCAALAREGTDRCSVHGAGWRQHRVPADIENQLRCGRCHALVRDSAWYRLVDGLVLHAPQCPKPDDVEGVSHA